MFRLPASEVAHVGRQLQRPESVMALADGSVLASDRTALFARIFPDGTQARYGRGAALANAFAFHDDGPVWVTDLRGGAVLRLGQDGCAAPVFDRHAGEALGAVNFILADEVPGAFWITESSRSVDYRPAIACPKPDGRLYHTRAGELTLAAEGLWFPNEVRIDRLRRVMYVVETTAGRVSRARLLEDGTVGTFAPFGPDPLYPGAFPDGVTLDACGNLWITELSRNAILVIDTEGGLHQVFDDPAGVTLNKPTSLAFGGPDLRTVFVGSLRMPHLATFRAPAPGLPCRAPPRLLPPALG